MARVDRGPSFPLKEGRRFKKSNLLFNYYFIRLLCVVREVSRAVCWPRRRTGRPAAVLGFFCQNVRVDVGSAHVQTERRSDARKVRYLVFNIY